MHSVGRFDEKSFTTGAPRVFTGHCEGYREAPLVNRAHGSVHTGLAIGQLDAGGRLDPHVHSYEEGFYILSGDAVITINGSSYLMGPGDYGVAKVGVPHAWRAAGDGPVRWLQMAAPQPKPAEAERDTFFPRDANVPAQAARLDPSADVNGNLLGHFDVSQIPAPNERKALGLQGLEGVFLKWMIDENFGARHHRMLFIEYQPGVGIGLHDHTFEEAYFILEGEVEAVLDGATHRLTPGDVVWTGVGCVHSFKNVSNAPVRWLETFAPQPPKEDVFRFMAQWEARAKELEG
jgi:quercetin dioxygenase-like cupin family protein